MNKKTRKPSKRKPTFVRKGDIVTVRIVVKDQRAICCELFEKIQQLGRFTLRDEGKTIAIGKITKMSQVDTARPARLADQSRLEREGHRQDTPQARRARDLFGGRFAPSA